MRLRFPITLKVVDGICTHQLRESNQESASKHLRMDDHDRILVLRAVRPHPASGDRGISNDRTSDERLDGENTSHSATLVPPSFADLLSVRLTASAQMQYLRPTISGVPSSNHLDQGSRRETLPNQKKKMLSGPSSYCINNIKFIIIFCRPYTRDSSRRNSWFFSGSW